MSDNAASRHAGNVDQLLHEAGLDDDGALRPALLELQALAAEQPPEPSAAVAALMVPAARRLASVPRTVPAASLSGTAAATGSRPGTATPVTDELAGRRRAKRRITLTTLSVAVSLAAGGAVAAASDQGIRDSIGQLNHAVTSFVSTVGGGPADGPGTAPVPVPQQPGRPASVPSPGTPSAPAPAPAATQPGTEGPQDRPAPGESGSVPLPKLPVPESLTPGVPSGLPGEVESAVPSVPAAPAVPLPSHVP
ncbi:MAG TPA: hypothetical protein VIM08_17130 [Arthrobacter sp.]|jgi:hypothetical protein